MRGGRRPAAEAARISSPSGGSLIFSRSRVLVRERFCHRLIDFVTAHESGKGFFHRLKRYFTLLIHLRIGPVTLVSAVSGDMTSEMWL